MRPDAENPIELHVRTYPWTDGHAIDRSMDAGSVSCARCSSRTRRRVHIRDAAGGTVVTELDQLAVGAQVKDAAGRVVGGRAKAIAAWQEPLRMRMCMYAVVSPCATGHACAVSI